MKILLTGIIMAVAFLLWAPDASRAQCAASQGTITVTLTADSGSGTFLYEWRIRNDDTGKGNALENAYFEIGTATPSNPLTVFAAWATSTENMTTFAGSTASWTAYTFSYITDEPLVYAGNEETFSYSLDQFVNDIRVRTVQFNGHTEDFADFTSTGVCSLLPVELVSFDARVDQEIVSLFWSTASEQNSAGFEIQYRRAESFETIGFVEANGTSDQLLRYRFDHTQAGPILGSYRLKMIDLDGTFEYSPEVKVAANLPGGFFLSHNYPNPFNPTTQFEIAVDRSQHVAIEVFDVTGKRVATLLDGLLEDGGPQPVVFTAGSLPSGLYVVRAVGETFSSSRVITLLK